MEEAPLESGTSDSTLPSETVQYQYHVAQGHVNCLAENNRQRDARLTPTGTRIYECRIKTKKKATIVHYRLQVLVNLPY